jgi:hypothetical protein
MHIVTPDLGGQSNLKPFSFFCHRPNLWACILHNHCHSKLYILVRSSLAFFDVYHGSLAWALIYTPEGFQMRLEFTEMCQILARTQFPCSCNLNALSLSLLIQRVRTATVKCALFCCNHSIQIRAFSF